MFDSLGDRIKDYESCFNDKIIRRLPVIIRVDGKSFSRLTRKLPRPFDPKMIQIMANTMLFAIKEMQGAVIGYQQSDEITFVLRNDQSKESEPWFQNRIQKMASVAGSLTTLGFNKYWKELYPELDLVGDAIFDARVFSVPSLMEAANVLIWRQQDCTRNAISSAALAELGDKLGRKSALKFLTKKSSKERKDLLLRYSEIDFDEFYPPLFRNGIVASKVPTIFHLNSGDSILRDKWTLNWEIPNFVEDECSYLMNILVNGKDVVRSSINADSEI